MKTFKLCLIILLLTVIYYLPILINPNILLNRGNDLQEQFWPVFYFIKNQLLQNHSLPLWNNLWLSGLPLLPDPQFSLFYPPNLPLIILPTDLGFIVFFLFHTFLGGLGTYLCARHGIRLSNAASLFTATIFIISPKVAGFLEAGHFGLVASNSFLPFLLLSLLMLLKKQKIIWSVVLGISLAGIFYTHSIIFILAIPTTVITFMMGFFLKRKNINWLKGSLFLFIGFGITFGLIAVTLLPQLEWSKETTRFLLLNNPDVYPKWFSKKEFIESIFIPWIHGKDFLLNLDTEKWITIGLLPAGLALLEFWQLKRKLQMLLIMIISFVVLFAANNTSPIYSFLITQDWYALIRVSTRIWFIITFLTIFLAGFGFEYLLKRRINKILLGLLMAMTVIELLFLSWFQILKPISPQTKFVSQEVIQFLKHDLSRFRVYCVNRCFSQKEAAEAHLELIEGYNTLLQKNYYKQMWQLSGGYWNYYTLSLPPVGTYTFQKPQPDAKSLGEYNAKYVISPYKLTDKNFIFEKQFGSYLLYKNNIFFPRAYFKILNQQENKEAPVIIYTPNLIMIDTTNHLSNQLILAEVFSPGWKAYLNGTEETEVLETPISLRLVNINPDTQFVVFKYMPQSFLTGLFFTVATIFLIISLIIFKHQHDK